MYSHFEEYARLVDKVSEDNFAAHLKHLIDINYSIHFHVWILLFLQLLLYCKIVSILHLILNYFRKMILSLFLF